jgi:hypothetical protein
LERGKEMSGIFRMKSTNEPYGKSVFLELAFPNQADVDAGAMPDFYIIPTEDEYVADEDVYQINVKEFFMRAAAHHEGYAIVLILWLEYFIEEIKTRHPETAENDD